MPKGKTGNPRGRPLGTRDEQDLAEETIYYALLAAFETGAIPFGDKPEHMKNRATKLAKLLADPRSQVAETEIRGWAGVSFSASELLGAEQFENSVRGAVQRRNGSKGQNHYLTGDAGLYVREAANYVAKVFAAQSPGEAFQATMTLRSRWHPAVTTRLYLLSLALQMARRQKPR
jgi:hypothetical protein